MPYYSEPPEDPRNAFADAVSLLLGIAIAMWVASMLSSCSPKVISVPEYHTEYVVRTDTLLRLDSIYKHDSVSIYLQGETICRDRYVTLDKYKYIYKTTTDTMIKVDSIRLPMPVERKLTKWERTQMNVGKWAIYAFSSLLICAFIYLLVWWYKNKT